MRRGLLLIVPFMILLSPNLFSQQLTVTGAVKDSVSGKPLEGAMLSVMPGGIGGITDREGGFALHLEEGDYRLTVRYMGFVPKTVAIKVPFVDDLEILMEELEQDLEAVEIIADGYQEIPRGRSSGSFAHLGEEQITRRVSSNLIDRLEDITSGLIINRTGDATRDPITIRGRSTLGRQSSPLIVLDNFPYDGNLEDINPNDIAGITVLRDAAAASIWGARAGNGVIVITTKSGKIDQPMRVSVNSSINWIEAVDPFRTQQMSVDDFIDIEEELFASGYYTAAENSLLKEVLTPLIETRIMERDGVISQEEAERRIREFRASDLRRDIEKYINRAQLNQQYSLDVSGGSGSHTYRFGVGVDRNREGDVGNSGQRITLNAKNDFRLLKDKLLVQTGIFASRQKNIDQNMGYADLTFNSSADMYPYARLADDQGQPLELNRQYSSRFKREAESNGLLDWAFVPLEEAGKSPTTVQREDLRLNLGLHYTLAKGLKLSMLYQNYRQLGGRDTKYGKDSYFVRDLVNKFTHEEEGTGALSYPVPLGGIWDQSSSRVVSHSGRIQADYRYSWSDWDISAFGGGEVKSLDNNTSSARYYGYDPELSSIQTVDNVDLYPQYYYPGTLSRIPSGMGVGLKRDRFYSLFANASIGFSDKYLLTFSARKDASNLFGVKANQKTIPLWSAGLSWDIFNEGFYDWAAMPYLKLRLSYGYNGNVDRSLSAFTTARAGGTSPLTRLPVAQIFNPPNENLRWERVKIWNAGLDFEDKSGRISGTVEVYRKNGIDLIGSSPFAPSTGISTFTGNNSTMLTKGLDVEFTAKLMDRKFKWTEVLLLSTVKDKVTDFGEEVAPTNLLNYGNGGLGTYFPVEGRPLFSYYSLAWAGLNSQTGAPQGYVNGEPSEDYPQLLNPGSLDSLRYHGPARPTFFGSLRNNFSYKGFSVSVNISFRAGYYFRRQSVRYETVLQGRGGHSDYSLRWKQPGDELTTQVPSRPDARNQQRDQFYALSSSLIEKGDHIRLQDIRFAYRPLSWRRKVEMFLYLNNIGILWKATGTALDPDFGTERPLRSIAAGIQFGI